MLNEEIKNVIDEMLGNPDRVSYKHIHFGTHTNTDQYGWYGWAWSEDDRGEYLTTDGRLFVGFDGKGFSVAITHQGLKLPIRLYGSEFCIGWWKNLKFKYLLNKKRKSNNMAQKNMKEVVNMIKLLVPTPPVLPQIYLFGSAIRKPLKDCHDIDLFVGCATKEFIEALQTRFHVQTDPDKLRHAKREGFILNIA
jgi:predicted nucleotidyltransferase